MAKKSRTPRPPRPVQSPKRRSDAGGGFPTKLVAIVAGAAVLVAAIIAGVVLASQGGSEAASGVCGEVKTFPQQERTHVQKLPSGFEYNSFPPTSGPHNPTPAIFNLYTEPVPEINLVHNLEHGAVILQYGSAVGPGTVDKITAWYRESPNAVIVAPLPKLGSKIVLTSWQHMMTCSAFDQNAFRDFRTSQRYNAPEKFPPSALQPGK